MDDRGTSVDFYNVGRQEIERGTDDEGWWIVADLPERGYRVPPPRSPARSQRSSDRAPGPLKRPRSVTLDLDIEALEGARDDEMLRIADRKPSLPGRSS